MGYADSRRIYKHCYGYVAFPVDKDGRTLEVHHIDGNSENDHPANLQLVTIKEHYDIHWKQADYGACSAISVRMDKTHEEKSKLAQLANKKKVEEGTHHWLGPTNNQKRLENGTHHLLGGEIQRKSITKRFENGTHQNLTVRTCPYCDKVGKGPAMLRHHFENCKEKR